MTDLSRLDVAAVVYDSSDAASFASARALAEGVSTLAGEGLPVVLVAAKDDVGASPVGLSAGCYAQLIVYFILIHMPDVRAPSSCTGGASLVALFPTRICHTGRVCETQCRSSGSRWRPRAASWRFLRRCRCPWRRTTSGSQTPTGVCLPAPSRVFVCHVRACRKRVCVALCVRAPCRHRRPRRGAAPKGPLAHQRAARARARPAALRAPRKARGRPDRAQITARSPPSRAAVASPGAWRRRP